MRLTHYTSKFNNRLPAKKERYVAFDGAGPREISGSKCMTAAAVLYSKDLKQVEDQISKIFVSSLSTNMYAEFLGLEAALELCIDHNTGEENWMIWTDSKYVRDCFDDPALVKKPHLIPAMERIKELAKNLKWRCRVFWIPREHNADADELSKEAFSYDPLINPVSRTWPVHPLLRNDPMNVLCPNEVLVVSAHEDNGAISYNMDSSQREILQGGEVIHITTVSSGELVPIETFEQSLMQLFERAAKDELRTYIMLNVGWAEDEFPFEHVLPFYRKRPRNIFLPRRMGEAIRSLESPNKQ